MLFSIDFENVFISIPLNILDIEPKEDSEIDESEEFNADIQIYFAFEREYKEFIMIDVNLNTVRNDSEKYLYDKDDLYLESNNIKYYGIIWINYIYDYCTFHLRLKAINNFFPKTMFKLMKKTYIEEETKH